MENMKRFTHLATIAALACLSMPAFAASPKLGWAGGSAGDHNASNASWYYRWWHTIPDDASGSLAEFIPLIKYPNNIQAKVNLVAGLDGVDTLLVLNEPEREDQSDTTVQEALDLWPTVQSTLPNHKLVSPSPSDTADGLAWLDSFMGTVESRNANVDPNDDLRVDAVAFHWYGASSPNATAAANNFLSRVDFYHQRYNRPLWVTEFAMHDWEQNDPTEAMIQANADFLEIVIPALESRSFVERYSYYNWFDDARVFEDGDRMPTVIGDQYVGTLLPGETRDLAGQSLGTDVVYLRGGTLTSTGVAVPEAMRAIDALGGVSTITGTADWSTSFRRDGYTRIREGASLIKQGPAEFEVRTVVTNDGTLRVSEGVLRLADSSLRGSGTLLVDAGATLAVEGPAGRAPYSMTAHRLEVSGRVEGDLLLTAGSNLTPLGGAVFTNDVRIRGSVVEVGGSRFSEVGTGPTPISQGLQLDYNAATDNPGDNVWGDSAGSPDGFAFGSPISPVAVDDPAFPGIAAAYPIAVTGGGIGLNQYFEADGPRSRQDATFEVVFRVDESASGADRVLFEVGGAGRGVAFVLNDDVLTFNVDGDGPDINLTQTLALGWHQAVGVIDLDQGSDTVSLYVNGQAVGSLAGQNVNDWAGGNQAGIGAGSSSVTGVSSGVGTTFEGDLSAVRYYQDTAFDGSDVLHNFQVLATAPVLEPTSWVVEGDLLFEANSELRLDLGDDGAADRVVVGGELTLSGTVLVVEQVGEEAIAAGDEFDLLDFVSVTGTFDTITLPALGAQLIWRAGRLSVDGAIEVALAGDFNADGSVDAIDYTVWRDSFGLSVTPFTAGDGNGDGQVNGDDLEAWRTNYGASLSLTNTIPEPAAIYFVGVLSLLLARESR